MTTLGRAALVVSVLMALAWRPATAQTVMVYDFGRMSCGYWLEARASRSTPNDVRFVQGREWLSGFLTAVNWYLQPRGWDVVGPTDRDGIYAWLDLYCREHPTVGFVKAAEQLVEHLRGR